MVRNLALTCLIVMLTAAGAARGAVVSGRVEMPELCSTAISPAAVRLESLDRSKAMAEQGDRGARVHLIDQRGMIFEPRVVALRVGETLRFGNADPDSHNVHIVGPGMSLNQVVAPGGTLDIVPTEPGVLRVLCDVHAHMRAFAIVASSPWGMTCGRSGDFRFEDVPPGRYRLNVWHEMGPPLNRAVEVGADPLDLGTLKLQGGENPTTLADRGKICETGCEPWPLVIDRISVTLAESLDAARRPDGRARAVPLAQDAYYRDFESSGMGTAIRVYLGRKRAAKVDDLFHEIADTTEKVSEGEPSISASVFDRQSRQVLMTLTQASAELNRKGVTERSKIYAGTSPAYWASRAAASPPAKPPGFVGLFFKDLAANLTAGLGAAVLLALLHASVPARPLVGAFGFGSVLALVAVVIDGPLPGGIEGAGLVATAIVLFDASAAPGDRSGRSKLAAASLVSFFAAAAIAGRNLAAFDAGTPPQAALAVSLGLAMGLALLTLAGVAIARMGRRASPRALADATALAAVALAVIAAGQGVGALQSARLIRSTVVSWPEASSLGTWQALGAQALIVAAALARPVMDRVARPLEGS